MIISILLNFILISTNIIFVWYIRRLWNIIEDTKEGIRDMKEAIVAFSQHLQSIYKQETFYGEPTIERLIKHSKVLVQEMDEFVRLFLGSEPLPMESNNESKTDE
jgi:hypothetical protein